MTTYKPRVPVNDIEREVACCLAFIEPVQKCSSGEIDMKEASKRLHGAVELMRTTERTGLIGPLIEKHMTDTAALVVAASALGIPSVLRAAINATSKAAGNLLDELIDLGFVTKQEKEEK